jgi:hypothetical protein
MVVKDKQTSHDSTSLCQKTWESSVSAHGPRQWVKRTSWKCVHLLMSVVDEDGGWRTEKAYVSVATRFNMPRQRPNC